MSTEILSNPKAGRVRRVSLLAQKKARREQGRFLVEGPQAVRELLLHRADLAEVIFASLGDASWLHEIERLASDADVLVEHASDEVLAAMSETVNPQGVIAVARAWPLELVGADRESSKSTVLSDARLVAILHEVRDPGNAGAVIRAADAAGADAVVFTGDSIDPFHPKVVRATTGSLFHMPVLHERSLEEVARSAQTAGLQILAADVRGDDLDADALSTLARPSAWLFGNEAHGLQEAERSLADAVIRLPIFGHAESLNLATAAAVLLYQSAFAARAE